MSGGTRSAATAVLFTVLLVGSLAAVGVGGAANGGAATNAAAGSSVQGDETNASVSEEAYVEPAPEEGDLYYEASDGNWVSYVNPRDEYRSPYRGDGSGKIGVVLLNEAGEPIVGETVPNTTVTIPTGEMTSWHSHADPITVKYPLTEHYERPLDADQFGTTDDLPQGDGYMDTHSIELHGFDENATVEYGQAKVEGEHADDIEVVGYVQQAHDTWDTSVDPIEDAESYEEAGGGWTYRPGESHGQVIVVLQLDRDGYDGETENGESGDGEKNETDTENATESTTDDTNSSVSSETNDDDAGDTDDSNDQMPGFGVPAIVVALLAAAAVATRRTE